MSQADVDAGKVVNTATVTGTAADGAGRHRHQLHEHPGPVVPALELDKTAGDHDVDGNGPDAGDTITYSFTVTNTGNVTLTRSTVTDPQAGRRSPARAATLAPGASATCTPTYTLTQADVNAGKVDNTATATGTAADRRRT